MKKRVLALILLVTIAVVGCGNVDEKNASRTSDMKKEIVLETEETSVVDAVTQEDDKGTKEETIEETAEEVEEIVLTEQVQQDEIQKTERKKEQTKTKIPTVTTPMVNEPVVTTQAVNKETCEHWYQPEFTSYEIIEHYTFGCNGCGFQLCTLQDCTDSNGEVRIDAVNLPDLYSHSPCETERFDGFCDGGGFHSHWFTSARCAFCYGEVIKIACFFSETGKMCIKNEEVLGPYAKTEEGQNPTAYIKSCDCGQNGIFVGQASEDSVYGGLLFLKETCVHCGDIKTYPQR